MDDSVTVASLAGSVTIRGSTTAGANLNSWLGAYDQNVLYSWLELIDQPTSTGGNGFATFVNLMPPTLQAAAFSGDINLLGSLTLAPAPRGTLTLVAAGSIIGFQQVSASAGGFSNGEIFQTAQINLSDANPAAIPSVSGPQPISYPPNGGELASNDITNELPTLPGFASLVIETGATLGPNATPATQNPLHDPALLHANDPEPLRLYALSGDITGLMLYSPKVTDIYAGRDILNIAFYLQNLKASDTSSIIAGRDIIAYDANSPLQQTAQQAELAAQSSPTRASGWSFAAASPLLGDISIGGPGTLDVVAGRNLNLGLAPVNSANEAQGLGLGIVGIGNARNPYLPVGQGAAITAVAGVGGFYWGDQRRRRLCGLHRRVPGSGNRRKRGVPQPAVSRRLAGRARRQ
jgi:filamentous hemagglutinin